MQIQVHTDHNIEGPAGLANYVVDTVESCLKLLSDRITRVEVHISDVNSSKGGPDDKHCMMEARIEGRQPMAVSQQASGIDEAVGGAADKLARLMGNTLERMHDERIHRTDPPVSGVKAG